jgi:Icc-related predicted phosphoesterase
MRLTLLSDTHSKHKWVPKTHFTGGDVLIHSGDISSMGYEHEIRYFLSWFDSIPNYTHKIFIAGNHDWGFQSRNFDLDEVFWPYKGRISYLEDESVEIGGVKFYGSPWQPEFYNWAFNLPRNGWELEEVWSKIPEDTDILITHGPAYGYVDRVIGKPEHLGCEKLIGRILEVKPSLHVCGHIHSGNGIACNDSTTFINASVLDESYLYKYKPYNIEFNTETKRISIL